jgi:hypothetical protein
MTECPKCHVDKQIALRCSRDQKTGNLPQKAIFRAKPNRKRYQRTPKSRLADVVNNDSLDLEVTDRQT